MPGYANPQNLNRFSYVINNPLRYTDPTGHMMDDGNHGEGGHCDRKCIKRLNQERKHKKKDKDESPSPTPNLGGGGGDKPVLSPALDDPITGGDDQVGYEVHMDVGSVVLEYYGQTIALNLEDVYADPVAYEAYQLFKSSADDRVDALQSIKSAQRDLIQTTGETLIGAGIAFLSPSTGLLSIPVALGGIALAAHGGLGVYNAATAWGEGAGANQTASANLSATWETLSNFP